jgi:hypothetical protein
MKSGVVSSIDLHQGHYFWYIVKEWCVFLAEEGKFTFKGLEDPPVSSSSISSSITPLQDVKARATQKMADILAVMPGNPTEEDQDEKYTDFFF